MQVMLNRKFRLFCCLMLLRVHFRVTATQEPRAGYRRRTSAASADPGLFSP